MGALGLLVVMVAAACTSSGGGADAVVSDPATLHLATSNTTTAPACAQDGSASGPPVLATPHRRTGLRPRPRAVLGAGRRQPRCSGPDHRSQSGDPMRHPHPARPDRPFGHVDQGERGQLPGTGAHRYRFATRPWTGGPRTLIYGCVNVHVGGATLVDDYFVDQSPTCHTRRRRGKWIGDRGRSDHPDRHRLAPPPGHRGPGLRHGGWVRLQRCYAITRTAPTSYGVGGADFSARNLNVFGYAHDFEAFGDGPTTSTTDTSTNVHIVDSMVPCSLCHTVLTGNSEDPYIHNEDVYLWNTSGVTLVHGYLSADAGTAADPEGSTKQTSAAFFQNANTNLTSVTGTYLDGGSGFNIEGNCPTGTNSNETFDENSFAPAKGYDSFGYAGTVDAWNPKYDWQRVGPPQPLRRRHRALHPRSRTRGLLTGRAEDPPSSAVQNLEDVLGPPLPGVLLAHDGLGRHHRVGSGAVVAGPASRRAARSNRPRPPAGCIRWAGASRTRRCRAGRPAGGRRRPAPPCSASPAG